MTGSLLGKERSIVSELLCLQHSAQERAEAWHYLVAMASAVFVFSRRSGVFGWTASSSCWESLREI